MNPILEAIKAFAAFVGGGAPALVDAFAAQHPKLVAPPPSSGEGEADAAGDAALAAKFPAPPSSGAVE